MAYLIRSAYCSDLHDTFQPFFSGCTTGQFGRNCSMLCKGCVSRMRDPDNGLCDITTACNPGYIIGKYCNNRK